MNPTITLITSPTPGASSAIQYARTLATKRSAYANFRAPHHTVSVAGIAGEMALAAGGVLLLDDPAEFSRSAVDTIARLWCDMTPAVRPHIVVVLSGSDDTKATASTLARMAILFEGWNIADHRNTSLAVYILDGIWVKEDVRRGQCPRYTAFGTKGEVIELRRTRPRSHCSASWILTVSPAEGDDIAINLGTKGENLAEGALLQYPDPLVGWGQA